MEWIKLFFDTALLFLNHEFTLFDTYTISFMQILIAELVIGLVIALLCGLIGKD